jgi:hypothetical protein
MMKNLAGWNVIGEAVDPFGKVLLRSEGRKSQWVIGVGHNRFK